jgi:hypothetical protein
MINKENLEFIPHSLTMKNKNRKLKNFESFEENLFRKKQESKIFSDIKTSKSIKSNSINNNTITIDMTKNNSNNDTISESDYSSIHKKEMIHVYFKNPEIKFLKTKKKKPIKIILKRNCIKNVIERNIMDSNRNKTFDKIVKEVNENYKKLNLTSSNFFEENNKYNSINKDNDISNDKSSSRNHLYKKYSDMIPSVKFKDVVLINDEKRFKSELISQKKINNLNRLKSLPSIKERKIYKIQAKKIGEEKANKTLKAIQEMKSPEYENLDYKNYSINQKNLNRTIELMNIIKYNKYDFINDFNDDNKKYSKSNEKNYVIKLINNLGPPRLFKTCFKNKTIEKFNNTKGTGFGISRNGEDIKELVRKLKYN